MNEVYKYGRRDVLCDIPTVRACVPCEQQWAHDLTDHCNITPVAVVTERHTAVLTGHTLPTDRQARKETPIARGVLDYFPLAIAEIARVSFIANEQHNPGQPMHWAKEKSTDHADCIVRHLIERGATDSDGLRHTAKVAWRALALLQTELEKCSR